jgi:hypothetical protein
VCTIDPVSGGIVLTPFVPNDVSRQPDPKKHAVSPLGTGGVGQGLGGLAGCFWPEVSIFPNAIADTSSKTLKAVRIQVLLK